MTVDENGKVKAVAVKDGDKLLIKAAEDCVRKWQFKPPLINGKPVESEMDVEIQFALAN